MPEMEMPGAGELEEQQTCPEEVGVKAHSLNQNEKVKWVQVSLSCFDC
jgi:hypothetical protein